jgi:alpha-D-xyloside xylohydrolase
MNKCKFLLTAFLATISLAASAYTNDGTGITVSINNSSNMREQTVRLTIINDNIIRVTASPETKIPATQSLCIVRQTAKPKYTVHEDNEFVTVTAKNVSAKINKKNGLMTFYDGNGKQLLNESEGSRTFTNYDVDGTHGYSWHLLFDSPDDEAFYGLGQHQSNDFNYKGINEELFQYNTKVSVPFVMSNKNYGLLWDSYSLCRWGNPADYTQLGGAFTLYDKNGVQGSLTGTYMDDSGKRIVRSEDSIYYEHSGVVGNLPGNINLDQAKVIYEGSLEAKQSATYYFILYYAGYTKVYIDGKLIVPERWRTAWNPNAYKFTADMLKGKKTHLRIEWKPDGSVSYIGLRVAKPQSPEMQQKLSVWSQMSPDMDYYFIAGNNMDQVISGYRTLTGRAQIMPKWSLGFWQSRERYKTQDDIVNTLREFRNRHIPIDNIVQDWSYWPVADWGSHQFDAARYPNPQAMLDSVHAMNGKFMISVWPKFYITTDNYKELDNHGWMYHQAVTDSIRDWIYPGYIGSFYDAYAPGARKMFWRQLNENMYSKYKCDIDAWWMDASEPNVRDCTPIEYRKKLCGPTALGPSDEYFNAYALENAEAIYNGQRSVKPNKRVFLLTRSGFAGLQRYSTATWSGDIGTRWEDMRAQMSAGLNYSMSGIPFWGMDIGGFSVEKRYVAAQELFDKTGAENGDLKEWRELQARWDQFGAFVPLYRTHGQWPLREAWNIAPANHPAYQSILYYHKLRYNMMPYLYSLAGWVNIKDYTIMRGLVMDFEKDSNVNNICDQWMFGPAFMVCPVTAYGDRQRDVYFPNGCGWYDFYTGKHLNGGQSVTVDAPYDRIPLFVREGAIIPFGPDMQYCDEKKPETINLYIYEGQDANFLLYEDEGTNYDYEKGQSSTINIQYSEATKTVTIGKRIGNYDGMLKSRHFNIIAVSAQNAQGYNKEAKGKIVSYNGKEISVKL